MRSVLRLVVASLFGVATISIAQITNVTGDQAPPIAGAGHDYIGFLNETVNPGNGAVSVRIDTPVPQGRKFKVPFAFGYASNAALHGSQGIWSDNAGAVSRGGWSYLFPNLNVQPNTITYLTSGGPPYQCRFYTNYLFTGLDESLHALPISAVEQGGVSQGSTCVYKGPWNPSPVNAGGDARVQASTSQFYEQVTTPSPVSVADLDGTVYSFSGTLMLGGGPLNGPLTELPASIEDRNGNLANFSVSGSSFSVTDSAGRTAWSASGFGNTGDTITISGLGNPYVITWTTANPPPPPQSNTFALNNSNGACNAGTSGSTYREIQTITLPNQQSYTFQYDPATSLLSKIIYPTGGYVQYVWTSQPQWDYTVFPNSMDSNLGPDCEEIHNAYVLQTRYVSFDGSTVAQEQDFSYSSSWITCNGTVGLGCVAPSQQVWTQRQATVLTKILVNGSMQLFNKTIYTYTPFFVPNPPNASVLWGSTSTPVESEIDVYDSSNNQVRATSKSYVDPQIPPDVTTTYNGKTTKTAHVYFMPAINQQCSPSSCPSSQFPMMVPSDEYDYDFGSGGPGALLRHTHINYEPFSATPIFASAASILDRPCQIITSDGGGNRAAEHDFLYDNGTSVCGSPGSASTSGVSNLNAGSTNTHDEANYAAGSSANRGNATSAISQCFVLPGGQSCGQPALTASYTYDETGQIVRMSDPAGNPTQYGYGNSFTDTTPPINTNAYVTQITYSPTNGVNHIENYSYAYSDGQLTASVDQNSHTSTYQYNDPLRRLTDTFLDGTELTKNNYADGASSTVTTTRYATPDPNIVSVTALDGLGHATKTQVTSDGDGTDTTDTSYDGLGEVHSISNPYRPNAPASTDGTTYYAYDALGRTTTVTLPDGTTIVTNYSAFPTVTVTDQAGNSRQTTVDGLGRLTTVVEPNPSSGSLSSGAYYTYYTYDALGDLNTVNQQGDGSLAARNRTFTYDSLSRLLSASNPESGTINYSYDLASDCPTPNTFLGDLVKRVDARNIRSCYQYDALHRLMNRNYSDTTPAVTNSYDQNAFNGLTIQNGIGRRTGMSDGTGQTAWSYDAFGDVLAKQQTINGVTHSINHTFDLNRSVDTLTSPNGRVYTYAYNGAGRPNSLVDNGSGITYTQNAHYAAPGELTSATHGLNLGITESNSYNNRLQPTLLSVTAPSETVMSLSYNFALPAGNNGSVYQIQNNRDNTRSVQFGYDHLNRLTSAGTYNSTTWGDAYIYDAFGNLLQKNPTQGTAETLQVTVNANNHINTSGFTYDAGGDLTWDGNNALKFDAEGHVNPVTGYVYSYDGDGRRVEKNYQGTITYYWYDDDSKVISTTNNLQRDYVYFNGKRLAYYSPSSGNQYYYWSDHLGSASVMSNSSGSAIDWEADYYPFGTPRVLNNYLENHFRFADYEWDPEMAYYYVRSREQSPNLGRFFTPDWSENPTPIPYAELSDPQSLNLYSYVRNNPLSRTDPSGHYEVNASGCAQVNSKCQKKWDNAADKFEKRRQKDLNSKKEAVRAAAANYGARGEANGVHLSFADLSSQHIDGSVDPSGSTSGNTDIQVTIDFSRAGSAETQTHEGTHIGDDMKFLNSFDPIMGYDQTLNITHFETEFNAFKAGAYVSHEHGFGPNDSRQIGDYIRANYPARTLNLPIFDPFNFPSGFPDEQ